MEKIFIKNRKGQKIAVLIEVTPNQKGLAFVMHGLGGSKEQPHIKIFAEAFKETGYTVIRFDTTHSTGESDGELEEATVTNYYKDLEDVLEWSKIQKWYEEPFCLAGHSLGGMCITLYAEKYPEKIKAIAPISATISGQMSIEKRPREEMENWKKTGILEWESSTKPGFIKRLKWSHMEDRLKYDILPEAHKLIMPVMLIVGENDAPENQRILYEALPGKKELHVIKNAPHTFDKEEHLSEINSIFKNWINRID